MHHALPNSDCVVGFGIHPPCSALEEQMQRGLSRSTIADVLRAASVRVAHPRCADATQRTSNPGAAADPDGAIA